MDKLSYLSGGDEVLKLVKGIAEGKSSKDFYDPEDGKKLMSSNTFYNTKRLAIGLGFVEDTGASIKLTETGKKLVSNDETTEIFQEGVMNFNQYRKTLEQILDRKDIDSDNAIVTSEQVGNVLEGRVTKRYQESRLRRAANVMFRVLERAELGKNANGTGRMNAFEIDIEKAEEMLEEYQDKDSVELEKEEAQGVDLPEDSTAIWNLESDTVKIEINAHSTDEARDIVTDLRKSNISVELD